MSSMFEHKVSIHPMANDNFKIKWQVSTHIRKWGRCHFFLEIRAMPQKIIINAFFEGD